MLCTLKDALCVLELHAYCVLVYLPPSEWPQPSSEEKCLCIDHPESVPALPAPQTRFPENFTKDIAKSPMSH